MQFSITSRLFIQCLYFYYTRRSYNYIIYLLCSRNSVGMRLFTFLFIFFRMWRTLHKESQDSRWPQHKLWFASLAGQYKHYLLQESNNYLMHNCIVWYQMENFISNSDCTLKILFRLSQPFFAIKHPGCDGIERGKLTTKLKDTKGARTKLVLGLIKTLITTYKVL